MEFNRDVDTVIDMFLSGATKYKWNLTNNIIQMMTQENPILEKL